MSSDKINDTNENINVTENKNNTNEENTGIQSENVESVQSENEDTNENNTNENNTNEDTNEQNTDVEKVENINVMERMNYYLNNMSNTFIKFTDSLQKSSNNVMNKFIIPGLNTFENTFDKIKTRVTSVPDTLNNIRKTVSNVEKEKEYLGITPISQQQKGGKSKKKKIKKKKPTKKKYNKK